MLDSKKIPQKRKDIAIRMASAIESTLESFGIKGKIMAITFEDEHILLKLSIAPGVRVEDIESLTRTLSLAVAAPTGSIEISQIPGTTYLGIIIKGIKL